MVLQKSVQEPIESMKVMTIENSLDNTRYVVVILNKTDVSGYIKLGYVMSD
jgi:hypothetical protein